MNTQDFDDGLVHGHPWMSEPPRSGQMPIRLTPPTTVEADYDDGLVHGHGWACSERGQPAG
ncbi:hypothetical protein C8P66_11185 [Humitalea rosea]|uniref:Uncharacterized protein n=1 Tax=Humitalea rosea TaxID=990373 RepID=A0A2W7II66_9PROT|nr:hypothetical protein [Humitalea rosea]PZW45670.1 hypothetical protein C8P66_11185 [Humitalea rosea]